MKSYKKINEASKKLYGKNDTKAQLEAHVNEIHLRISEDFKVLFGEELCLNNFQIYIDDQTYRQGVTGLILEEAVKNQKEFRIRVECLINHGKIWLKVIQKSENSDFDEVIERIENAKNDEGQSELKKIK